MLIPLHKKSQSSEVELCVDFPDRISSDWKIKNDQFTIDFGLFFVDKDNNLYNKRMAIFWNNTQDSEENPSAIMEDAKAKVFFRFNPERQYEAGSRFAYLIAFIDTESSNRNLKDMGSVSIRMNESLVFSASSSDLPKETTMIMAVIDLGLLVMKTGLIGLSGQLQDAFNHIGTFDPPNTTAEQTAWEHLSFSGEKIETFHQLKPEDELFFVKLTMTANRNRSVPIPSIVVETQKEGTNNISFGTHHPGIVSYTHENSYFLELHMQSGINSGIKNVSLALNSQKKSGVSTLKGFSIEMYSSKLGSVLEQNSLEINKWETTTPPKEWGGITSTTKSVSIFSLNLQNRTLYGKIRSSELGDHTFPNPPNNPMVVQRDLRIKKSKKTESKTGGLIFDKKFQNNHLRLHTCISKSSNVQVFIEGDNSSKVPFTINSTTEEQTKIILEEIIGYDKVVRIDFSLKR